MIYKNSVQEDTSSVSIASNASAVTETIEIDCFDGHTFSLVSGLSTGATIEFQHATDGAWTAIETGVYDLSPFASDAQPVEFSIRYDPDATAWEALRFRVGKAETSYTEKLTFNSIGVYFGSSVTFEPGLVLFSGSQVTFLDRDITFAP